jgi:hypothetical protein
MHDPRFRSTVAAVAIACVTAGLLAASPDARAAKKDKKPDRVWTHPDFASFGVDRIAMIPTATYDGNLQAVSLVEGAVGQALRPTGYRWIGSTSTRDIMRAQPGGDSLLKAVAARLLTDPRVDSLAAPRVCGMLRCDALLSVRVDQWEQQMPEWNQSGTPTTTVQLRAALVDSLGRLLWSASSSQTADGPYFNANAGVRGVKDSGLERVPITGQGGPPSYREVVTSVVTHWAPQFPAKSVPAAADSASVTR